MKLGVDTLTTNGLKESKGKVEYDSEADKASQPDNKKGKAMLTTNNYKAVSEANAQSERMKAVRASAAKKSTKDPKATE